MRARPFAAVAIVLCLAAWGCVLKRTKPARTFVLDAVAVPGGAVPAEVPVATVGVLKVTVPDWFDRPQLTGRAASGEIVRDEFARWGEAVPRGVQRVVAENLAALLPDRRVVRAPFPPAESVDVRLDLTLTEAARQTDGSVLIEARWALLGPRGATLVQRRSAARAITPLGPEGAVAGVSEALAGISREIAGAIRALPAAPKAPQP